MGFLKNMIRNAVNEGISKGIREAVSSATEKIVAPKAEAYANKVAQSLGQSAEHYATAMEAVAASQEDLAKIWAENVPDVPMWCFGGKDPYFDVVEAGEDGTYIRWFYVEDATAEQLALYIGLLKENGFVRKYPTADEVLYKDLGGVYVLVGFTEAFGSAPTMSLAFQKTKDRSEIEI